MLMEMLKNSGEATVSQIAQAILNKDPTQIEYFSESLATMTKPRKPSRCSRKLNTQTAG
jgi:hypothetical protein